MQFEKTVPTVVILSYLITYFDLTATVKFWLWSRIWPRRAGHFLDPFLTQTIGKKSSKQAHYTSNL